MNNLGQIGIVELSKNDYFLKEIRSRYSTPSYYDVSIVQEPQSWRVSLVRRDFEGVVEKTYFGRLFEEHVQEPHVFAALLKDKQVGWIELGYDKWNNRMRVWELLVDEEHRRKGFGTLLMKHAVNITRERGARMLVLETQTNNAEAIDFYLNFGFEFVGLDVAAYSNEDVEKKEVRLELGLKT
jgi:ribosomal protein S18 acetylase RimI-like enzyme